MKYAYMAHETLPTILSYPIPSHAACVSLWGVDITAMPFVMTTIRGVIAGVCGELLVAPAKVEVDVAKLMGVQVRVGSSLGGDTTWRGHSHGPQVQPNLWCVQPFGRSSAPICCPRPTKSRRAGLLAVSSAVSGVWQPGEDRMGAAGACRSDPIWSDLIAWHCIASCRSVVGGVASIGGSVVGGVCRAGLYHDWSAVVAAGSSVAHSAVLRMCAGAAQGVGAVAGGVAGGVGAVAGSVSGFFKKQKKEKSTEELLDTEEQAEPEVWID
jgi:hypothetical protein